MDAAQLKEAVTKLGGPEYVFSLGYDNVGRIFFNSSRPFSYDMIDGEFIKVQGYSLEGHQVVEIKPIETIQSVVGVTNPENRDMIDRHYFRS